MDKGRMINYKCRACGSKDSFILSPEYLEKEAVIIKCSNCKKPVRISLKPSKEQWTEKKQKSPFEGGFEKHDDSKLKFLRRVETRFVEDGQFEWTGEAVKDSSDLFRIVSRLAEKDREHAVVIFMDNSQKPIGYDIYSGCMDMVAIDSRQIFKVAWLIGSNKFAVCHNHPASISDPRPSSNDETFCFALAKGAEMMGFILLDFIIVSATSYYSFKDSKNPALPEAKPIAYTVEG
jgi:hypothetical protein